MNLICMAATIPNNQIFRLEDFQRASINIKASLNWFKRIWKHKAERQIFVDLISFRHPYCELCKRYLM